MGTTSSPDPETKQFEYGMLSLFLHLASLDLLRGTLTMCDLLLTLPMGATWSLDPRTRQLEYGVPDINLQFPSALPLVTKFHLFFMHPQMQKVGSETQKAVYYIGYRLTLGKDYKHLVPL